MRDILIALCIMVSLLVIYNKFMSTRNCLIYITPLSKGKGFLKGLKACNRAGDNMEITHFLGAHDSLVLSDAKANQLKHLRLIPMIFEAVSGVPFMWKKSMHFLPMSCLWSFYLAN